MFLLSTPFCTSSVRRCSSSAALAARTILFIVTFLLIHMEASLSIRVLLSLSGALFKLLARLTRSCKRILISPTLVDSLLIYSSLSSSVFFTDYPCTYKVRDPVLRMLVICRFLQTVYTGFKFIVISHRGNLYLLNKDRSFNFCLSIL